MTAPELQAFLDADPMWKATMWGRTRDNMYLKLAQYLEARPEVLAALNSIPWTANMGWNQHSTGWVIDPLHLKVVEGESTGWTRFLITAGLVTAAFIGGAAALNAIGPAAGAAAGGGGTTAAAAGGTTAAIVPTLATGASAATLAKTIVGLAGTTLPLIVRGIEAANGGGVLPPGVVQTAPGAFTVDNLTPWLLVGGVALVVLSQKGK